MFYWVVRLFKTRSFVKIHRQTDRHFENGEVWWILKKVKEYIGKLETSWERESLKPDEYKVYNYKNIKTWTFWKEELKTKKQKVNSLPKASRSKLKHWRPVYIPLKCSTIVILWSNVKNLFGQWVIGKNRNKFISTTTVHTVQLY